jgi:putative Holliday junction resolvase
MARYIAFDWGKARTGIAVSDSAGIIASPHSTIPTSNLHATVELLVNEEPCAGLVVGVPGLIIGSVTDSNEGIDKFIAHLTAKHPDLPLHKIDEGHTSSQAMDALISGGMKKSKRREKGSLDKVAAALILQRFLQ